MADRVITWSKTSLRQFEAAINYISLDSIQNAQKVRLDILNRINQLPAHPEIYTPDKYRINNDNSFRAFEIHRYRISYQVTSLKIYIIRIRHTSREPKLY